MPLSRYGQVGLNIFAWLAMYAFGRGAGRAHAAQQVGRQCRVLRMWCLPTSSRRTSDGSGALPMHQSCHESSPLPQAAPVP